MSMCRNLRQLFNFDPPATAEEIHIASLQFVKKISGFNKPSKANLDVFIKTVSEIEIVVEKLINDLVTRAKPKNREIEAEKAKVKFAKRYQHLSQ